MVAAAILVVAIDASADISAGPPAAPRAAASSEAASGAASGAVGRARQLWLALPESKERCGEFDYFPEGGMRNFYCHLLSQTGWAELQKIAGMPIFLKGPHSKARLDLKSRKSFGYYNPELVRWLGATFIPAAGDEKFRALTQPIYDKYVRPLARTFYASHEKLRADGAFLEQEKRALLAAVAKGRVDEMPYEKYYNYTGGEYDGNVSKTAVAFWIRRSIDGTDGDFFSDLTRLLGAYDARFLAGR